MPAGTENTSDGLEDVNDFLLRIRELGDKRDKEDEERARKLEEEILQGRRERQARRAGEPRLIAPAPQSPNCSALFKTQRAQAVWGKQITAVDIR
jgi:hypothetical protein